MNDAVFRQRISSIMTDNMYERRVKGRTRGQLDMRSLYKAGAGSKNIFTQKMAKKGKQYNIVLLIDESGSMGRHGWGSYKIQPAAECAVYLYTEFEKLNINVAVVGFNRYIITHKGFHQKLEPQKLSQKIIDMANGDNGWDEDAIFCGHDLDALAESYKMLYGKKGTNLVIAFSDGRPNCDWDNDYDQDKHRTERIRAIIHDNETIAKTIGVGVEYEATQFPSRIFVKNAQDLKVNLTSILKQEIRR